MTTQYMLFPSSGNQVDLYPDWDLLDKTTKIEDVHRARSGAQYRYKWGSYYAGQFSLTDVNSSDASLINSWWLSNTDLLWTQDSGATVEAVHITNKAKPIGAYMKPYQDLFHGKIELEGY